MQTTWLCIWAKIFMDFEINTLIELNSCIKYFADINLKVNNTKTMIITVFKTDGVSLNQQK